MEFDPLVLWRSKWTLALGLLVGLAAGFGYLALVPPEYLGQARVLIEPRDLTPEAAERGRVHPEFLPTQVETIRSPLTIARALQSQPVAPPPGANAETFDPVRHVLKSLSVTPVLRANVVTISYRSTSPEQAVGLIAGIVAAYEEHVRELDTGDTQANTAVIAAREQSLREDLKRAQQEYDALRRSSPLVGQGREANSQALVELNQIASQLAEVRQRRSELEVRLQMVDGTVSLAGADQASEGTTDGSGNGGAAEPVVVLKPVRVAVSVQHALRLADPADARALEQLQERLRFARLNLQQLDETYGDQHPRLIAARLEVNELESLEQQRLDDLVDSWRHELEFTTVSEKELERSYQAEQEALKGIESYLVQEQFLRDNVQRLEQLHAATANQLIDMQTAGQAIAGGRSSIDVRILEAPVVIDDMTWPKPQLLLAVAACLGFMASFGLVVLRQFNRPPTASADAV